MSKKTREARHELQKYLVNLARSSPSKKVVIRYDKLYIDGAVYVFSEEEGRVLPQQSTGRLSRGSSFNRSFESLSMSTPDLSQPSYFRSPSPISMATPDLSTNVDHKLKDLEGVLCQQKLTITEQKEEISVHKKKIRKLERAVQHLYKEDYNLEDID
eukprot:TRINITY_DN54248_c0_g1_i1.p1 TRINITY_DN54248_c0_g1~~TRINITY_DN54248_c0_g1_i1.p1  ORF type:complete len:177 (-),score=50.20 TRINITY_DN54248_c0_g1_i1:75-545(-)